VSSAEQYARDVLTPGNEQKTGRLIKLAAQRFLDDLKRDDIYFDEDEAVKMLNFGEKYCYQWEDPFAGVLIEFQPWQRFIFEQVYGWFRREDSLRRFTEVYIQIAKKNGKSTGLAAIPSLFHLFAESRIQTPNIFTAANNEDQARICVNMAGKIIEASPELAVDMQDDTIQLMRNMGKIYRVVHNGNNGMIQALAKEADDRKAKTAGGKHGINSSLGVVDEFSMSPDHGASKVIKTSMATRKEPLMLYITTAGYNMDGPCFKELRHVGIEVLEGVKKKDNYLPIIFEIDNPIIDGKPTEITSKWLLENEWSWQQANPNIGISVQRHFLKSQLEDAVTYGGQTEIDTLTLNFDKWCASPETWISADTWNKNHHGNKEEILSGGRCFGSVELVPGLDLSCLTLFFPEFDGTNHAIKLLCWCPSDAIANKNLTLDVRSMADDGLIALDAGNVVDNQFAFELIVNELSNYNCESIAYRKVQENSDVIQAMIKAGIKMNPIKKSYNELDTPTKEWEKLFTAGQIEHFNNPVLNWMNLNTMVNKSKDGEIKVIQSGGRTSGIVAGVHALAEWMTFKAQDQNDAVLTSWK
jgi:phage terminase large subunit-like protein